MSDDRDDATTGDTGDSAAGGGSEQARPSGKRAARRSGRTALAEPSTSTDTAAVSVDGADGKKAAGAKKAKAATSGSRNPFAAVWLFLRQVVAELRKVIWPTRPQMINYTIIVLVFVVVLTAFVSLLDLGFAKLMLWAFG